jgi:AcrR family transcriptional regulator
MNTEPRILRTHVDNARRNRPPLPERQRERQEFIIAATQTLMATFNGDHFTLGKLALAMRMTPATIRRYFIDVESILAVILLRHLVEVSRAIGRVPPDHPNRRAAQRAAYIEATRTGWGALNEPHQLLIEARRFLPPDLAKPIEDMRRLIGEALAGERWETGFTLLDAPHLAPALIETMLAATDPSPVAAEPKAADPAEPAPPQTPAPPPHKPHYRDWRQAKRLKAAAKRAARAHPPP